MTPNPLVLPWCKDENETAVWYAEQALKDAQRKAHHRQTVAKRQEVNPDDLLPVNEHGEPLWNRVGRWDGSGHRPRLFDTPQELWDACVAYFEWAERNYLEQIELFSTKAGIVTGRKPLKRVYTIEGLCVHIGVTKMSWIRWRSTNHPSYRGDLAEVIEYAEAIIYEQKFTGAAVGLFNASLITRDLGLADKQEIGGIAGAPPVSFNVSPVPSGQFIEMKDVSPPEE
jgi:hypothetical protein